VVKILRSQPSSLFSLFFPKIYSERHPLCRRNPRLRPIGSCRKQRRASLFFAVLSLFLILIEIAWYFADLRTPSSSLARPQDMGPAGPPVFAGNLQALTIPLLSPRTAFNTSYCYLSFPRGTSMQITTKIRNCQLKNGSKMKIRALGSFLPHPTPDNGG
jgi:hypothetical protein